MTGLILGLILGFALGARRLKNRDTTLVKQLGRWGLWIGGVAGYLLLGFVCLWGVNIHRPTLPEQLNLAIEPASPSEVLALTQSLAAQCEALAPQVPRGSEGHVLFPEGIDAMGRAAQAGYEALARRLPQVGGTYAHPKVFVTSEIFSYLGIAGMFFPYTFEAQLNDRIPSVSLPFTACHEMAHQRGYVREDEANFVGYLACEAHPDALYRYAAAFNGLLYSVGALQRADPSAVDALLLGLGPEIQRDLAALRAYRARYSTAIATGFSKVHDASLKAQGQSAGVQTYGKVVDLLLARQRLEESAPKGPPPVE